MLSHECLIAGAAFVESGLVKKDGINCGFVERSERRGAKGGGGLFVCGMQRKRAALWRAEARHLSEIEQELSAVAGSRCDPVYAALIPVNRGNFDERFI